MSSGLQVEAFQVGPLENNAYLVIDEGSKVCVLVDPGMDSEPIAEVIRGARPEADRRGEHPRALRPHL